MNTKRISITVLIVALGAAGYMVISLPQQDGGVQQQKNEDEEIVKEQPADTDGKAAQDDDVVDRPDLEGPEGWVKYWNDEWGIGFMYPPDWNLKEQAQDDPFAGRRSSPEGYGNLGRIKLEGDGYSFVVVKPGRGVPEKEWTNPEYYIDGYKAPKTWEYIDASGYEQLISMYPALGQKSLGFEITSTASSKMITDKILSSVKFY